MNHFFESKIKERSLTFVRDDRLSFRAVGEESFPWHFHSCRHTKLMNFVRIEFLFGPRFCR